MRSAVLRAIGTANACVYRLSGGRVLGRFPGGAPVCLLSTTGRKSGTRRTVPLLYLADGDDFVVVASQGGAPRHPGWYFNLVAAPVAQVQIGRRKIAVTARRLTGTEKTALWPRLLALYPPYAAYQQRTDRDIPVVRLTPM